MASMTSCLLLLAFGVALCLSLPSFSFAIPSKPHFFTQQVVDHFSALRPSSSSPSPYYSQRYYLNQTHFLGPGSPILLIIGGEGAIPPETGIFYPFVEEELASSFGALVVQPEHRFYGLSQPVKLVANHSEEWDLSLLSPRQALEDLVTFTEYIRDKYGCATSRKEHTYCPVITIGGSYPGWLSAMARLRYPNVFDMAYAASAPIKFYSQEVDQYAYYKVVTESAEKAAAGCSTAVRSVVSQLYALSSLDEAVAALDLCDPLPAYIEKGGLQELLTEISMLLMVSFANLNMGNYPPPATQLRTACQSIVASPGLATLKQHLKLYAGGSVEQKCFPLQSQLPLGSNATVTGGDWSGCGAGQSGLMWDYETSTVLIEKIGTNNVTDMFPPRQWTMSWLERHALSRFGVVPQPLLLADEWGMTEDDLIKQRASRIVFTNGLNDGWSAGGILTNISMSLLAVNMRSGAHHSDLSHSPSGPQDTPDVLAARVQVKDILALWLERVRKGIDDDDIDCHGLSCSINLPALIVGSCFALSFFILSGMLIFKPRTSLDMDTYALLDAA